VIAGALAGSRAIHSQPPPAGIPPDYSSAPPYYAYTVPGDVYNYVSHGTRYSLPVPGRYLKVRATSTGKLLATVSPPKPYDDFSLLTGAANGRMFVFGAMRHWEHKAGAPLGLAARDQRTPMVFLLLRITAAGHLQSSTLSLPETLTPQQLPNIALSPDGTRLAVAFRHGNSAVVQVITLGTGRFRTWAQPRASLRPLVEGQGAWSGNGRTLVVADQPSLFSRPAGPVTRYHPPTSARVLLLDTARPGSGLQAASRVLVLHAPAGRLAPGPVFLTPDGAQLVGAVRTDPFSGNPAGELAVYSARDAALLHTRAPWRWAPSGASHAGRGGSLRQTLAWSNSTGSQLIVLQPRKERNVLGVVTGQSFAETGSAMLPGSAACYRELQYVLRTGTQMTW
jgi:hypothetical protein